MKDIIYFSYTGKIQQVELVDFKGDVFIENKEGLRFLHSICRYYGASFTSRKASVKLRIRGKQKMPLLLSETYKIVFFPVYGGTCKSNIWIQYKKVDKITTCVQPGCIVHFCGGEEMFLDVEIRSLRKQIKRCKAIYQFLCDL